MKKLFSTLIFGFLSFTCLAQWQPGVEVPANIYYNLGKVGIGAAKPTSNLEVRRTDVAPGQTVDIAHFTFHGYYDHYQYQPATEGRIILGSSVFEHDVLKRAAIGFSTSGTDKQGGALKFFTTPADWSFEPQERLTIDHSGYVGIGTKTPNGHLEVNSDNIILFRLAPRTHVPNTPLDFVNLGQGPTAAFNAAFRIGFPYPSGVMSGKRLDLLKVKSGNTILATDEDGNSLGRVTIGTEIADANALLTIKGGVMAREVKVTTNAGADFVFEEDYLLPSLKATEQFIKINKHLPEIPSAKEMIDDGVSLGELNIKLLQKIEELTLYVIEQSKKLETQNEKIEAQEKVINSLVEKLN